MLLGPPVTAAAQTSGTDTSTCAPTTAVTAVTTANEFDHACYAAPANTPFTIALTNNDPFAHNLSIYKQKDGDALFTGAYVPKTSSTTYNVPALPAGAYYYQCDIHPFMNGKFAVGVDPSTPMGGEKLNISAPAGFHAELKKVADGFVAPVFVTGAGDGSGRLFVVDQVGQIWIIDGKGNLLPNPFLNIQSELVTPSPDYDERGLLGLAFHPDYKDNGRFFVWYNAPLRPGGPAGFNNTIHLSEFHVSADNANLADPASEKVLMAIDHPYANHNSGHIAFGPDGLLYMPLGDGGNANDVGIGHTVPQGNGQDLTNLLGKILRIDVDHTEPNLAYAIPKDNPYADGANGAQREIYANGFRNPYHISFDAGGDHALYAADAGQDRYEEISRVTRGGNFGWNIHEGKHCFSTATPSNAPKTCPDTGVNGTKLIDPVLEYNHTEILGSVIIGGYVYRGDEIPNLKGTYVFGDYSRNRLQPDGLIFQAATQGSDAWKIRQMDIKFADAKENPVESGTLGNFVLSFGQDDNHELYVTLTSFGGPRGVQAGVYKFVSATPSSTTAIASTQEDKHDDAWYWLPLIVAIVGGVGLLGWALVPRNT